MVYIPLITYYLVIFLSHQQRQEIKFISKNIKYKSGMHAMYNIFDRKSHEAYYPLYHT